MIQIKQIDMTDMTLGQIAAVMKSNPDYYIAYYDKDADPTPRWVFAKLSLFNLTGLIERNIAHTIFSIKSITDEELKDIPFERVHEFMETEVEEALDEKGYIDPVRKKKAHSKFTTNVEPQISNKACYGFLASNSTGSISLIPKSNGTIRINFASKEQAEAYLKQFRRKMQYATNSVDAYTVANFYSMLGLVLTSEQQEIATNYAWPTVSKLSDLDKWLSPQVTKTNDETGWYGFTISKRASRLDADIAFHR